MPSLTPVMTLGFDGPTTLEAAGHDVGLKSVQRLQAWSAGHAA